MPSTIVPVPALAGWEGRPTELFKDAAWREHGDVGRDGDSNVRYCNLHGLNLLDLPGLKWFCLPKNRTLTGGGIYYQRRPLEAISLALA